MSNFTRNCMYQPYMLRICWSWTNGFVLVLIQVELIQIGIRSILAKTSTSLLHSNSIHSSSRKKHDYNFFSGRDKDRALARQRTRTFFFSVVITKLTQQHNPPDRRLKLFFLFPVVIKLSRHNKKTAPPDRWFEHFFFPVVITFPAITKKLTQPHNCIVH